MTLTLAGVDVRATRCVHRQSVLGVNFLLISLFVYAVKGKPRHVSVYARFRLAQHFIGLVLLVCVCVGEMRNDHE